MSTAPPATQPQPLDENRFASVAEIPDRGVVWAYTGGPFWREVRVIAKARTRVTVEFWQGTHARKKRTVVPLAKIRRSRPQTTYGVLSTPAPALFGETPR
jgi:hypothetical protein